MNSRYSSSTTQLSIGARNSAWQGDCGEVERGTRQYEVSNENDQCPEWDYEIEKVIREREAFNGFPCHLIMRKPSSSLPLEDLQPHEDVGGKCTGAPGCSGSNNCSPENQHECLKTNFNLLPRPLIADNDGLPPPWRDEAPNVVRKRGWGAITAGAYLSYQDHRLEDVGNLPGNIEHQCVSIPLNNPVMWHPETLEGMKFLGYTTSFLNDPALAIDLTGGRPDDSLVTPPAWCFALGVPRQHERIVYVPTGMSSVQVSIGETCEYDYWWFNPVTGQKTTSTPLVGVPGCAPSFTTPNAGQDWVLYVTHVRECSPCAC